MVAPFLVKNFRRSHRKTEDALGIAREAFSNIAARFPALEIVENRGEPVEISLTLPKQAGLKFDVRLALQNGDELHFSVGHLWMEWFPCTDAPVADSYVEAVTGFLSGEYRVLEYWQGGTCAKAKLQKPRGEGWRTVATWGAGSFRLPWGRSLREIRNR
ncbi:hypothetical protein SAMN05444156_3063 [Verrucomicrobium sp. GAS474]|uniref:hypothetical protein n=1 Tax=Verrucomicrobium sp. GAS474 TaxID=1882831 RepID=UPI00087D4354|nr:hypothetical protein [Verrucomicrobium sp. GAS474]SDU28439.1 hypothetical protein SAMN05444156_3063 [Verrucomicrobium sp. GAS474]